MKRPDDTAVSPPVERRRRRSLPTWAAVIIGILGIGVTALAVLFFTTRLDVGQLEDRMRELCERNSMDPACRPERPPTVVVLPPGSTLPPTATMAPPTATTTTGRPSAPTQPGSTTTTSAGRPPPPSSTTTTGPPPTTTTSTTQGPPVCVSTPTVKVGC